MDFFLCEQKKKLGLDWITGNDLGLVEVTGSIDSPCLPVSLSYDQQRTPFHHGWFPLPAGVCCVVRGIPYLKKIIIIKERKAKRRLDFHLFNFLHSQQTITTA